MWRARLPDPSGRTVAHTSCCPSGKFGFLMLFFLYHGNMCNRLNIFTCGFHPPLNLEHFQIPCLLLYLFKTFFLFLSEFYLLNPKPFMSAPIYHLESRFNRSTLPPTAGLPKLTASGSPLCDCLLYLSVFCTMF